MSVRVVAPFVACFVLGSTTLRVVAADDILPRMRAMYGNLRSYADTGVVLHEYGTGSKDRHTFATTFNRMPRRFFLDFLKQGGDRYVIWGDPDAFHTWWKTTGDQYDYPNPNNAPAISQSGQNTGGAVTKIPTLLYAKAPLGGDFLNFADPMVDGMEDLSGHRCYRVLGTSRDVYGATGKEVNVRKMTLWIDSDSLLIRKVVEQWKALPGQTARVTTTFEPQANPLLDDSRFRFIPPAPR